MLHLLWIQIIEYTARRASHVKYGPAHEIQWLFEISAEERSENVSSLKVLYNTPYGVRLCTALLLAPRGVGGDERLASADAIETIRFILAELAQGLFNIDRLDPCEQGNPT